MPAFLIPVVAAVAAAVAGAGAHHAFGAHQRNKIKKNAKKMEERLKHRKPISESEAKDMYKNWEKVKKKGLIKNHIGLQDLPSNKKDFFNDIKKYNKKAEKHNLKADDLKQFGGAPGFSGKGFSLKDQLKFQEAQLPIQKKAAKQQIEIAKKYGKPQKFAEEKLLKPTLYNKKQNKLLDQLAKQGIDVRKSLQLNKDQGFKQAEDTAQYLMNNPGVTNPSMYHEFGLASNALEDLVKNQGVVDPRSYKEFQAASGSLQNLLQNQGISDIRQNQGYQQAQASLNNLFGQSPTEFSQPYIEQYRAQTLPGLKNQFGGRGAQSGSLNRARAAAEGNLYGNLALLHQNKLENAREQQLKYSQAPESGEVARANVKGGAAQQLLNASGINTEAQKARAHIKGGAAEQLYKGAGLNTEAEKARANILGGAANQAANYAQQKVNNRQQEIQNIQNSQQLALGAKPFENLYQPAQYYNVTGLGATQAQPMYGGGQQYQQQQKPYQPGWGTIIGGAAAQGIGQGLGQGFANAGAQAATNWFNPTTPAAPPKATPIFQNNQMST